MASVFTKIINREIPGEFIFENENIVVIKDINPQARIHLLVIPKKEIPTIDDLQDEDQLLIGEMVLIAKKVAADLGITNAYQLHFNVGEEGGQVVPHIHMHLMSNKIV